MFGIDEQWSAGKLLDPSAREVHVEGRELGVEGGLLLLVCRWDVDAEHLSNVIDVYIRYLRNKLCTNGESDVIHTIRGSGYQLKEP